MEKQKIKLRSIVQIFLLVVLFATGWRFFYAAQMNDEMKTDSEKTSIAEFVNCLNQKGVVMYGSSTCDYCEQQKKMFGKDFKGMAYVDCLATKKTCQEKSIVSYPTWEYQEKFFVGIKSFEELSAISECKFN